MSRWINRILLCVWLLGMPSSWNYFKDFRTRNGHRWVYRDMPVCAMFTAAWPISVPLFKLIDSMEREAGVY